MGAGVFLLGEPMKTSSVSILCAAGLLLCVLCGCEPKVASPLDPSRKVPLSVAEAQLPIKAAADIKKNEAEASAAKAKANALLDDAAAQVAIINDEASVSAKKSARPIVAQAKAEASEIVSIATANIEARNSSNEVYAAELQAARASYDAQLGWASTGIDYAKGVVQQTAGSTPLGGLLLAGLGLIGVGGPVAAWKVRSKVHEAENRGWDESEARSAQHQAKTDATWDQAQVAAQLQSATAALIALLNKNHTPPPTGTVS